MFAYNDSGDLVYYGSKKDLWFIQADTPHVFFPALMETGVPYKSQMSRTEYENGIFRGRGYDTLTITVTGPEWISVPAGAFEVYRFTIVDQWQDSSGATGTNTQIYCLTAGLGWVRLILEGFTYDLASFSGTPPSEAPFTILDTIGTWVNVDWTRVPGALGYSLNYAPYPDWSWIGGAYLGNTTHFGINLWEGAAFYVYILAHNYFGASPGSNIKHFVIQSSNHLSVSPSEITLQIQENRTCTISGGGAPYGASSSNTSVATASVSGSTLSIIGVGPGTATVTVTDSAAQSVTVSVSVTAGLSISPSTLSLTVGQTGAWAISGGTAPYGASWSESSVATASVSGSTLTVYGVSSGTATVTVWDSASRSAAVSVTVSGGTPSTYTNSLGQTFVLLPAGTYTRGSPSNEPGRLSDETQHQVTLTKAFYMQTTEVTQSQWQAVMGSNPSYFSGCPNCSVEKVS